MPARAHLCLLFQLHAWISQISAPRAQNSMARICGERATGWKSDAVGSAASPPAGPHPGSRARPRYVPPSTFCSCVSLTKCVAKIQLLPLMLKTSSEAPRNCGNLATLKLLMAEKGILGLSPLLHGLCFLPTMMFCQRCTPSRCFYVPSLW